METDRSAPTGNASSSNNNAIPNASSSGHIVRRVGGGENKLKEYVSGSEVYDLLLKVALVMMEIFCGRVTQMRMLRQLGRR
jgi:hypothetical protein